MLHIVLPIAVVAALSLTLGIAVIVRRRRAASFEFKSAADALRYLISLEKRRDARLRRRR